jgi:5-formyltetrahydrofolate cyclo-ligase
LIVLSSETDYCQADKRALRRTLRAQRRALSVFAQRRAAIRLAQRVTRLPWFIRARSIALYLAADGEIDPLPLMQSAWRCGKRTFLPTLQRGNRLAFVEFRAGAAMRANRFGILEPQGVPVPIAALDVVCMPLVGFDRLGGRLGMGGGFYDRTFARSSAALPALIGLAHSFQECGQLPRASWDIPLCGVVTEREWIRGRR